MQASPESSKITIAKTTGINRKLRAENKTLLGRGTGSNILGRGLKNAPGRALTFAFGKNKRVLTECTWKTNCHSTKGRC